MVPWCNIWVIIVSSANSLPAICHPTPTKIALYWSKTTSLDLWLTLDLISRWSLIKGPVVGIPNQYDWTPVKQSDTLIPRNDGMRYEFKKWIRNMHFATPGVHAVSCSSSQAETKDFNEDKATDPWCCKIWVATFGYKSCRWLISVFCSEILMCNCDVRIHSSPSLSSPKKTSNSMLLVQWNKK